MTSINNIIDTISTSSFSKITFIWDSGFQVNIIPISTECHNVTLYVPITNSGNRNQCASVISKFRSISICSLRGLDDLVAVTDFYSGTADSICVDMNNGSNIHFTPDPRKNK